MLSSLRHMLGARVGKASRLLRHMPDGSGRPLLLGWVPGGQWELLAEKCPRQASRPQVRGLRKEELEQRGSQPCRAGEGVDCRWESWPPGSCHPRALLPEMGKLACVPLWGRDAGSHRLFLPRSACSCSLKESVAVA